MIGRIITFLAALFCLAIFIASVSVHVLSLIPGTVLPFQRVVWLHGLTMLAFFLMIVHGATLRNRAVRLGRKETEVQPMMERQAGCGVWVIGLTLFVYAMLNFGYFAVTVEGSATIEDGKYVLKKKSVFIREINEAEYHEHRRHDLRGMSGHWLIFSWVATSYFFVVAPRMRAELDNLSAP
jgi:hypothetical protein